MSPALDIPPEIARLEPLARDAFVLPTNAAVGAHRAEDPGALGYDVLGGGMYADKLSDAPCVYFRGNSLGPMPKLSKQRVEEELDIWAKRCVAAWTGVADGSDQSCIVL